jgi:hypothetical protein
MTHKILAQAGVSINGGPTIANPLLDSKLVTLGDVINRLLPFLYGLAALILFGVLLWGGYDFILSRGEPEKIGGARMKITAGIIGFVLLVISYLLVRILGYIFGIQGGII